MARVALRDRNRVTTMNPSSGKFVTVSVDVWVLLHDIAPTVILFEDPMSDPDLIDLYEGHETLFFPKGQNIPAEWWNSKWVASLGGIR